MAFSEVYVDPSIAADSGTGSIFDPFGDLEYGIRQTTFDITNGTRVNIKAGTAEVLAASLETAWQDTSVTPAWVTGPAAPVIFQGYTSAAGDGGMAEIDSNGFGWSPSNGLNYQHLINLKIHNYTGTGVAMIYVPSRFYARGCEFTNATQRRLIHISNYAYIDSCYFHDSSAGGAYGAAGSKFVNSVFKHTGSGTAPQIYVANLSHINDCLFICTGTERGIYPNGGSVCMNNSVYSDGGAGLGIHVENNQSCNAIINNLVEGFSGVGGAGISFGPINNSIIQMYGNAVYNCTTAYGTPTNYIADESWLRDNEVLSASPFNDAANGDFSPVDVGSIIEGALPQLIGGGLV